MERGLEATTVLTAFVTEASLPKARESAPGRAGRMRDDRPRPGVEAGVTFLVPQVDIGQAAIDPILLDVQRGDHRVSSEVAASETATARSRVRVSTFRPLPQ